ncbi:MAG: hypothetical protein KKA07_03645, partial [Bacteroidetes bacterium]|nr:hypothetical protein [Bacteroidota bacterium]
MNYFKIKRLTIACLTTFLFAGSLAHSQTITREAKPAPSVTTQISAPTWAANDFSATFADSAAGSIGERFALVCGKLYGQWFAKTDSGYFCDDFNTGIIQGHWTNFSGTWSNYNNTLKQESSAFTNTNLYASVEQNSAHSYLYHWKMKNDGVLSGSRRAGIHFFADEATTTNRTNSYMVYFRWDEQKVQIYKSDNNSITVMTDDDASFVDTVWIDCKITYSPNGQINVYLNDTLVSSWVDPLPFLSGQYISLRTGNSVTFYDDFNVYKSRDDNVPVTVGNYEMDKMVWQQNPTLEEPACRIFSLVVDNTDQLSAIDTGFVNIDFTPPTMSGIYDLGPIDKDTLRANDTVMVFWNAAVENYSGLSNYFLALGTNPGANNEFGWTQLTLDTAWQLGTFSPIHDTMYYYSVFAMDSMGNISDTITSDGFIYYAESVACMLADFPFTGNSPDDVSGNGYTGILTGHSPLSVNDRFENSTSAYKFNGEEDYIEVSPDIDFFGQTEQTISVWIKPSEVISPGTIIGFGDPSSSPYTQYRLYLENGKVKYKVGYDASGDGTLASDASIEQQVYYHIVCTKDASGLMQLYINGVLDNSTGSSPGFNTQTPTPRTTIGATDQFGGEIDHFDGIIDDLKVFDCALNSTEIEDLYEEGSIFFLRQLTEQIMCSGSNTTISVEVKGDLLSYKWFKNNTLISGATGNSYDILSASIADTGTYSCTVWDNFDTIYSDTILLTLKATYYDSTAIYICDGDSVYLEGGYQNTAGFYTDIFTTTEGCDSMIFTELVILSSGVTVTDTINKILHDGRDCQQYPIVKACEQWWMQKNLNTGTMINSSVYMSDNALIEKYCYDNSTGYCDIYGGLYEWDEVMNFQESDTGIIGTTQGICPQGWHVPTKQEWSDMIDFFGGTTVAGGKLKATAYWNSPNTGATNESGFTILPAGFKSYNNATFDHLGYNAYLWSSTQYSSSNANYCYLGNTSEQIQKVQYVKTYGLSLRCAMNPPLQATITSQTNVTCPGAENGSATITPSGGTPPYSYLWMPSGATDSTATNLAAGW